MNSFEFHVPVLVVGGGACGCVAALAAQGAGASVLLAEQDAVPAGSTGMSQGLICAAGTQSQADHGINDDADLFYADILAKTRGATDPHLARAIATGAGPTLDWLVQTHDLPWQLDTGFRAAYGHSVQRVHGWHGRGGTDMIQLLHQRLGDRQIDVMLQARLVDVLADADGRVQGAVFERPDGSREAVGCDALILASGGFAANRAMVAAHMPEAAAARYNGHDGNRGEGIMLGARLGGALADMGSYQGYAMLTDPQAISVPPGVIIDGGVIVNATGARFVDEMADIAGMVHQIMAQPDGLGWVIFDDRIAQACAYIPEMVMLGGLNAAKSGETAADLARAINVDPAMLAATLDAATRAFQAGAGDPFGRQWRSDCPPPVAPYHAFRVGGAIYHTQGGLQTDGQARVLRADGSALPNLFAGGGAARGVSGPSSWGYLPAMGLCAAVTTGRLAGQAAAALSV
jgi:fumarate reductase flavoprotein subunit